MSNLESWPAVDEHGLMERWQQLVELESGSKDSHGLSVITEVISESLDSFGCQVTAEGTTAAGASHLVAFRQGTGQPIMLLGHLDTVWPAKTLQRNPFRLQEEMFYGPGVADMKGGLAVLLAVLDAITSMEVPPELRIVLTSDEELGSVTGRAVVERHAVACRAAFVLEPGRPGGHLVDRRRGSGVFTLSVEGRTAHAANNPQDGVNAVDELSHQLVQFSRWRDLERGTYLMAGVIEGGTARQVVPDHAEALIDVRASTRDDLEELTAWLRDREKNVTVPGAAVKVNGDITRPVMEPVPGTEALRDLVVEAGLAIGEDVSFAPGGGGSDGNFTAALGIPTIDGFGPVGHRMCSLEEAAEPESAVARTRLLATVLRHLSDSAPNPDE